MRRPTGFTLIELLVVIAIITILAGIVLPNVAKYISRARATRAIVEIHGIDLALTKMLTDVGRDNFAGFFNVDPSSILAMTPAELLAVPTNIQAAVEIYTDAFYILLKNGKNADLSSLGITLNGNVQRKLSSGYMTDLGRDPWGNLYQFFAGPWRGGTNNPIPFVIRDVTDPVPGGPGWGGAVGPYTVSYLDTSGNTLNLGYDPSTDLPMYVSSMGANLRSNQPFDDGYDGAADLGDDFVGGGDDINNWDKESSWSTFY
jgi:prepilin-type N-terminal cleavage/methylation domain-containing protein